MPIQEVTLKSVPVRVNYVPWATLSIIGELSSENVSIATVNHSRALLSKVEFTLEHISIAPSVSPLPVIFTSFQGAFEDRAIFVEPLTLIFGDLAFKVFNVSE
jgi:hypothetical protein